METIRTPDTAFEDLPDWPYLPHYTDTLPGYEGLRMARVDEGPRGGGDVFLCLHGEPSWSYLYRHMIPVFLESGARVVAPDLYGFGRSDKPVEDAAYTWDFHRLSLLRLIEHLDLRRITLVCQDWGGILGLTLPHAMPDRFDRLIVMNTSLPTGKRAGEGFAAWRDYVASHPDFPVGALMKRATPHLGDAEVAAYDAPFPDARAKAGVRRFPQLVMTEPGMDGIKDTEAALDFWRHHWTGQSFMAVGVQDPVLGPPAMAWLHRQIRDCPAPMMIEVAGHFVQEWGKTVAEAALASFRQRSSHP